MDHLPHTIVLTHSWAFHVLDGRVLAAQDRKSGALLSFHEAVGGEVLGCAPCDSPRPHRAAMPGFFVGAALCVRGRRGLFCSGAILGVERIGREAGLRRIERLQDAATAPVGPRGGGTPLQQLLRALSLPLARDARA